MLPQNYTALAPLHGNISLIKPQVGLSEQVALVISDKFLMFLFLSLTRSALLSFRFLFTEKGRDSVKFTLLFSHGLLFLTLRAIIRLFIIIIRKCVFTLLRLLTRQFLQVDGGKILAALCKPFSSLLGIATQVIFAGVPFN